MLTQLTINCLNMSGKSATSNHLTVSERGKGKRFWYTGKWLNPSKAMVQLSTRYKYADIFWFSFFHELGHILLHSKKEAFAETGEKTAEESEADRFAADCLIPASKYRAFLSKNRITQDSIRQLAHEVGIKPGIVVGRLHHDQKVGWSDFQDLQRNSFEK
jgi:HTH-type transcriptional regulator / antitoxin HigA